MNISFFRFFFYLFIVGILFNGCADNDSPKKRDGLIVYQESQISWTRNFNPLSPAGTARWPTKCGIYEPLYIYNSMTTKWVPWLAESYRWKKQNKVLEVKIRDNVVWSDGVPFTANDVAFTTNIKKKFTALDTRNAWAYLESCLLYTSPSPRDRQKSRMPSSA